jgi:ferrochelatase
MSDSDSRTAVVIFNLGGPDSLAAVRPFLFNLFNDPYIITLPTPIRWIIATMISTLRAKKSRGIYDRVGGKSVLLPETQAQADALQKILDNQIGDSRVFIFMRYWHPMAREVVADIKSYEPTRIVVLPLYPQFSTTTTQTSIAALKLEIKRQGMSAPMDILCCYPTTEGFVAPVATKVREAYDAASKHDRPRVLFSAHGLPEKIVAAGDPYQWQVEQSVNAIVHSLSIPGLDYTICYQSRVGPYKWLQPSIEEEIRRAGRDGVPLIVTPVAFVSEHVETLVELDEDMKMIADEAGVPFYTRVGAVRTNTAYIVALANFTAFVSGRKTPCSASGARICPANFTACPHATQNSDSIF